MGTSDAPGASDQRIVPDRCRKRARDEGEILSACRWPCDRPGRWFPGPEIDNYYPRWSRCGRSFVDRACTNLTERSPLEPDLFSPRTGALHDDDADASEDQRHQ